MILVEGLDGTGKTTLVSKLKELGMTDVSFDYDKNHDSFFKKYMKVNLVSAKNGVLDRSFISEMAKGDLVRGVNRLTNGEYIKLLEYYKRIGTTIVYLTASKEKLLERRKDDVADFKMITMLYDKICEQYNNVLNIAKNFIAVYKLDTTKLTPDIMNKTVISKLQSIRQLSRIDDKIF